MSFSTDANIRTSNTGTHGAEGLGHAALNAANIHRTAQDLPQALPVMTLAVILVAGLCMLVSFGVTNAILMRRVAFFFLFLALLVFGYELSADRKQIRKMMQDLADAVLQLRRIQVHLSSYLASLDRRTSRYFHCVTNTKVTTYFVLRQLESALNLLVSDLEIRVGRPSRTNYVTVRRSLLSHLEYRDGFDFNSGQIYRTPVVDLAYAVEDYIEKLELGVSELECEIMQSHMDMKEGAALCEDEAELEVGSFSEDNAIPAVNVAQKSHDGDEVVTKESSTSGDVLHGPTESVTSQEPKPEEKKDEASTPSEIAEVAAPEVPGEVKKD